MTEDSGPFKSTRWTTVLRAGKPELPGADLALAKLCEDYRPPLHQFARLRLNSPEDAEDLTQSFFCHFVRNNVPGAAGRDRGRFRTFLLACFKNFMRDEWRRGQRARVIPAQLLTSLQAKDDSDAPPPEPAVASSLDQQLDSLWAESIRERVILQLEMEYEKRGRGTFFERLCCLLRGQEPVKPYSELGVELGMSKDAVKTEVLRLRQRFRQRFREEVAETVEEESDLDEECRYLVSLLFARTV